MDSWIDEFYNNGTIIGRLSRLQEALLDKNAPKVVYQYRSIDKYNVDNIKNGVIWARKATDFNDPYDCMLSTSAIQKQMKIAKEMGVTQFLDEWEDMQNAFLAEAQSIRSMTAISCFSLEYDSLLMWSHYANQHQGICVAYDYRKLEKISHQTIMPVSYGDKIDIFQKSSVGSKKNIGLAFVRKAKVWKYEKEWRIIALLLNTLSNGMTVKAPLPEKIIFGSKTDFSNPLVEDLINFSIKKEIVCSKMILDDDVFRLNEISL